MSAVANEFAYCEELEDLEDLIAQAAKSDGTEVWVDPSESRVIHEFWAAGIYLPNEDSAAKFVMYLRRRYDPYIRGVDVESHMDMVLKYLRDHARRGIPTRHLEAALDNEFARMVGAPWAR